MGQLLSYEDIFTIVCSFFSLIEHGKNIILLNTCINNMYKQKKVFNVLKRHNPIVSTTNNAFTEIYQYSTNSSMDNWKMYINLWTKQLFRNTIKYFHVHQEQLYQLFQKYKLDSYKQCLEVMYNHDYLYEFNVNTLKNKLEQAQRFFFYKICCFPHYLSTK